MSKYILCELHNHTFHSDGSQTLHSLALQAKALGFDCIALTDHNTDSGCDEIAGVHADTGVLIARGIEYTTFFGHFLVLGKTKAIHFKNVYKTSIEDIVKSMRTENSVVGIAHPFAIGNPICTGCFFEYDKQQPDFEYMEVWSEKFSTMDIMTELAMHAWDIMLNDNRRICGVLGRDWHREEPLTQPLAATALIVGDDCSQANIDEQVVNAIKSRHAVLTLYKIPDFSITYNNREYITGDDIYITDEPVGNLDNLLIRIGFIQKSLQHSLNRFDALRVSLNSNTGQYFTNRLDDDREVNEFTLSIKDIIEETKFNKFIWLRMEAYGMWEGIEVMVAVTNPIFIDFSGIK